MVHVGARIMRACVTRAPLLERAEVVLELRAFDVVPAIACENRAVARASRGCDTVERVAAVLHACEDVVHRGDSEHMTWPLLGHLVADPRADVADDALFHRAANTDAVEVERRDLLGRAPAQVLVIRALHHAVERLVRLAHARFGEAFVLVHTPARPAECALDGILLIAARVHERRQLIEREHDVGADLVLDVHRDFRGEAVQ